MDIPENSINTPEVEDENDVFKIFNTTHEGLIDEEVNERLETTGCNQIVLKEMNSSEQSIWNSLKKFLLFMWNPLSWIMILAAFFTIILSIGGGKPPEWEVFLGIILLLLMNSTIGFIQQRNIVNTISKHIDSLAPEAKVKRNGEWEVIHAAELVPGDIIDVRLGDVAPADGQLIDGAVLMDQSSLTGESYPVNKSIGDGILSGSICRQGEGKAIVTATGLQTFTGNTIMLIGGAYEMTYTQRILLNLSNFRVFVVFIVIVVEILVMYIGFRYNYRRGINNILILVVGSLPLLMTNVISVILAMGRKQLSKYKILITYATAIIELASINILCIDKTGTLTLNKLSINKLNIKKYSDIEIDDIIYYAALASRTEDQDAIDACITSAYDDIKKPHEDIKELDFKSFNSIDKRTEITYRRVSDGTIYRSTKGLSNVILDICIRDKTSQQIKQFNSDVDEFAKRGLRSIAVAIEDIEEKGNGFKLIGLIPIYDPLHSDAKKLIEHANKLNITVKMITGDELAIAKEIGQRLNIGDTIFSLKTLRENPSVESNYQDVNDLILHADGFSDAYPEDKYEIIKRLQNTGNLVAMIGDGVNDMPAIGGANAGIAVKDACNIAYSTAGFILTDSNLLTFIEAIRNSRQIFERIRNYIIYTYSISTRVIITFSILLFAFKFDFPLIIVFISAIINDGALITIALDRIEPVLHPTRWNIFEIVISAFVYGVYLSLSTIIFFILIVKTTFFYDKFGVEQIQYRYSDIDNPGWNDPILHSIIFLQISIISQALIFITRSNRFFFMYRPSLILVCAFIIAQFIATFIAVYVEWPSKSIQGCGWSWAGIVWIWNIIWFLPLDLIKFTFRTYFNLQEKQAAEEQLTSQSSIEKQPIHHKSIDNTDGPDNSPSSDLTITHDNDAHIRQRINTKKTTEYSGASDPDNNTTKVDSDISNNKKFHHADNRRNVSDATDDD